MATKGDVALFIDFENIRYSALNQYGLEPDLTQLMEKARTYGMVVTARAYADFTEHPAWVRRQLDIAGITAQDVPVRRFLAQGVERVKSSADLHMLMDIVETALSQPNVETYVLMTGDSDYIRVVTWLKNRFGKRVVVSGIPGAISQDLVAAADEANPIEVQAEAAEEAVREIAKAIVRMMRTKTPPLGFWTIKLIDQWARDARNQIPGTDPQKSNAISYLVRNGVIKRTKVTTEQKEVTVSELTDHDLVREVDRELQLVP